MTNAVSKLFSRSALLFACALALGTALPALAQSFSTVEERMSAADFHAAGLDKLSAEELAALNTWLRDHVGDGTASTTPVIDRTGFAPDHETSEVRSRLVGEFHGWDGKTTFHLENGQVWQQVGSDTWSGVKLDNPRVTIETGFLGSWRLKVEGYNTTTKVRRVR